jgi:hypothetical protein
MPGIAAGSVVAAGWRRVGMTRLAVAPISARPAQAPIAGPKPLANVAGEA